MPVTTPSSFKLPSGPDIVTFSSHPGTVESSSDDHSSPPASSQVSSCAVSRRTSIGPHLRSAGDDGVHFSTSESHENSIVRAKPPCGAEILNFEHLKMQLDKLTGQNKEKQRQSDAEGGNSTVSPSPSCVSISLQATPTNLPNVGSWPLGLDRTPSIDSDVSFPADSGVSSMRSVFSAFTENTAALSCKCTSVEQKPMTSDAISVPLLDTSNASCPLASVGGGHQLRNDSSMYKHHYHHMHSHQHVAAVHGPFTEPAAPDIRPLAAHLQPMSASPTLSAFRHPGFSCEPVQPMHGYSSQRQQLHQQSLIMAQQMQAQNPAITQCQQMFGFHQLLLQHQQAFQRVQFLLRQSPDLTPSAFGNPAALGSGPPLHSVLWQAQLANLLVESGLSPGKSYEIVQQLQQLMSPLPAQIAGMPTSPLLNNSGCSFDALSLLQSCLAPAQFCVVDMPASLQASWSCVCSAYARVVQLLAHPNPLITPELLESMFAQLPTPLNLNPSRSADPGLTADALRARFLELLSPQFCQVPFTPMHLTPPVSFHSFFGNDNNSSTGVNKLVGAAAVQSMTSTAEGKLGAVVVDSKQLGTPTKVSCPPYPGADASNQACPLHRGVSLDLESDELPAPKVAALPRVGVSCSRHHGAAAGSCAAKLSGNSAPKKTVDCPQGLADLDMALKEKLRPRATKAVGQTVPEHAKTPAATVVSNGAGSVLLSSSQSAAVSATCDAERFSVSHATTSNGMSISATRSTSAVFPDASAVPKLMSTSVTKCAASAVKKQQASAAVHEALCKAGDVVSSAATLACFKVVTAAAGNTHLPELGKDAAKPASGANASCGSVVPSTTAAKSSSQFRECFSDHCFLSNAVSLPLLSVASSDVNRQHASDSAIAATTTHLAQRHLQKNVALTDHDVASVPAPDVTVCPLHPATSVS